MDGPGLHPDMLLRTLDARARAAQQQDDHDRDHSAADTDHYFDASPTHQLLFSGFMRDDPSSSQYRNENDDSFMDTDLMLMQSPSTAPTSAPVAATIDPDGLPEHSGISPPFLPEDDPELPSFQQEGISEAESDEVEDEDNDEDDRQVDDSERERNALHMYEWTHPDNDQKKKGGREITELEAMWSVSTFRPDWGVEKMRDNNPLTYWQSDCANPKAPHTIDLFFAQATVIQQVSLFIDFFQDESYCPKQIVIRGGTTYRDLCEIVDLECEEMVGWKNIDFTEILDEPVRVFQLQIAILSTHLNGRDTHVRQLKVYSTPTPRFLVPDQSNPTSAAGHAPHTLTIKGLR
ncbi:galactose-binding like protein [Hesseltinella vesiculosa]|uniref:Galactose-binding like protein n=1 Tax=Hesseltinella vesiculosa TaxID=101127 RepID=A0A1X2GXG1_9FUNG|nr:galactose-binding like protein [Hesseltinella vesiculosa]